MDDELKIKVSTIADDSPAAKTRFKNSVEQVVSDVSGKNAPKVEVSVSVNKDAYQKLKALRAEINKLEQQYSKTPTSNLSKRSELNKQYFDQLNKYYDLLNKTKLSEKQFNDLLEKRDQNTRRLKVIKAENDDKRLKSIQKAEDDALKKSEKATKQNASLLNKSAYSELKNLQTLKNSLGKQLSKTDNSDVAKRVELLKQVRDVSKQIESVRKNANLTDKQNNELVKMGTRSAKEISLIQAENADKKSKQLAKESENKASLVNKEDFDRLNKLQSTINSLNKKLAKTDNSDIAKRAELIKQINSASKEQEAILKQSNITEKQHNALLESGKNSLKEVKLLQAGNDDKQTKLRLKQIADEEKARINSAQKEANALAKLRSINNAGTITTKLANTSKDIEKFKAVGGDPKVINQLTDAYTEAKKAGLAFKDAIENKGGKGANIYYQQYLQQLERIKNTTSALNKGDQVSSRYNKEKQALNNLILQMQRYEKANDKMRSNSKFSGEFNNIYKQASLAYKSGNYAQVGKLTDEFKRLQRGINEAGIEGQRFGTRLRSQLEKLGVYFSAAAVFMSLRRVIRDMITDVVELDKAMTELKKVTNEADSTYSRFLDNAEIRAKRVGATLTDVVRATAEFAKLGYGIHDAENLSDASIIYKNVADGVNDIGESSATIIAAMKSFGVESENVMQIVDKFNEVGKMYAHVA